MQFLVYISRQPAWSRFQRMHRGWERANFPYPLKSPLNQLVYRRFMRKNKPHGRPPMWNAREPSRFGKLPRVLFPYPLKSPLNQLVYRRFMRKNKPHGRPPMFSITSQGVRRLQKFPRSFVNPPNPKLSLHYRRWMRKNKPHGRKPFWQTTEYGVKRYKRLNRDYPLPFRQAFVPYVTPQGPQKWRNTDPSLAVTRVSGPSLSKLRTNDPSLED